MQTQYLAAGLHPTEQHNTVGRLAALHTTSLTHSAEPI